MIRYLRLMVVVAAVTTGVSLALTAVAGQGATGTAKSTAAAKPWTQRTPDGQPDLQGVWSNDTVTPLERPRELAGKAELTDAELEAEAREGTKLEGIDFAPEGGAAIAAARTLRERAVLGPEHRVVLFNTGAGWLYRDPAELPRA